jgi:hypothetical protein
VGRGGAAGPRGGKEKRRRTEAAGWAVQRERKWAGPTGPYSEGRKEEGLGRLGWAAREKKRQRAGPN